MTPKRLLQLRRKLEASRTRLLKQSPRFAGPLRELRFIATRDVEHMSTNGVCLWFDPDWLAKLSDRALDFMLSHELMHIGLGHIHRPALYRGARYHLACDIVANSLLRQAGWTEEKLPGVGVLYHATFFPVEEGCGLTPEEAFSKIPMDPDRLSPAARRRYRIDSEAYWDRPEELGWAGELVLGPEDGGEQQARYRRPRAGTAPRRQPAGENGEDEEFQLAILDSIEDLANAGALRAEQGEETPGYQPPETWDAQMKEALKAVRSEKRYAEERAGELFTTARVWQRANHVCLDWRQLLDVFLQEEICDYSFTPPDRRYQDQDFFLPDFSDTQVQPLKLLFMVDASGSVSDERLSVVYTEISSAIEQFRGRLTGFVGFFDTMTYPPKPFASAEDLRRIQPYGGGGTDFACVFRDCRKYFGDDRLASLVILTDGQADFPEESAAQGIPTLWLLTDEAVRPPWGWCAWLPKTL